MRGGYEGLTNKELAFVNHPDALIDPVKAYIDSGYSEATAQPNAYALLKRHMPIVLEKWRARAEQLGVGWQWIKNEVAILARTAPADFLELVQEEDGHQWMRLVDIENFDKDKYRAAIKEIKFETVERGERMFNRVAYIKFYDRQKALMDLADLFKYEQERADPRQEPDDTAKYLEVATTPELEQLAALQAKWAERLVNRAVNAEQDKRAIDVEHN